MRQEYLQIRVLELAPQVFVSGQLFETDVKILARQGIRTIVSKPPDGEAPGQPLSVDRARAAEEYGVDYLHFPVASGAIAAEDVEEFAGACDELERPIRIVSRSGARSTKIWELAEDV